MKNSDTMFETIKQYRRVAFDLSGMVGAIRTFLYEDMSDSAKISCIKALIESNCGSKEWRVE